MFAVAGQRSASAAFMEMPLSLESPSNSQRASLASLTEMAGVEVEAEVGAEEFMLNI